MSSPTQWTWVWAHSGRQWRTRKPGMLPFMGSQRVSNKSEHSSGCYDVLNSVLCASLVTATISHSSLHRGTIVIPILQMRKWRRSYVNWSTVIGYRREPWQPGSQSPYSWTSYYFFLEEMLTFKYLCTEIWAWRLKFTLVIHNWADFHWHELGGRWSVQAEVECPASEMLPGLPVQGECWMRWPQGPHPSPSCW